MAGRKGRSGRKPQSAGAAFRHFAEEYTERGHSRFEEWLQAEHEAALSGDGAARRFLIEQYVGKARQAHEVATTEQLSIQLQWSDGTPIGPVGQRLRELSDRDDVVDAEVRELDDGAADNDASEKT